MHGTHTRTTQPCGDVIFPSYKPANIHRLSWVRDPPLSHLTTKGHSSSVFCVHSGGQARGGDPGPQNQRRPLAGDGGRTQGPGDLTDGRLVCVRVRAWWVLQLSWLYVLHRSTPVVIIINALRAMRGFAVWTRREGDPWQVC